MQQVTEEQISNDLIIAGEDPGDPLARALYLEALEAARPISPQQSGRSQNSAGGPTLISRITAASHLAHSELGALLGVSRATIQAYGSGRIPERYDAEELAAFKGKLEAQAVALAKVIGEIAKMQNEALH